MKRIFLFLTLLVSLSTFAQSGVKITDLPSHIGDASNTIVPVVVGGATKQTLASNLSYGKVENVQISNDSIFVIKNGGNKFWVGNVTGKVTSFNSRTGAITPAIGDYSVSMITGLQTQLDKKQDTGKVSNLYFTWPLRLPNDSTVAMNKADATHDGYLDSLDWTNFNLAVSWGDHHLAGYRTIQPRVATIASGATITPNIATTDVYTVTALATAATIASPAGGTPAEGQEFIIRIRDDGTARALTWNSVFRAAAEAVLPASTDNTKTTYIKFIYNSQDSKWDAQRVWNVTSSGGVGGGGAPTVFAQINFTSEFGCGSTPANWTNACGTNTAIANAGSVSFTNIINSSGTPTTWSITNGTGFNGYATAFAPPDVGQPANSGVFEDLVIKYGWEYTDGAHLTIGGLTNGQQYTVYFLSNAPTFTASTVSFTVAGVTSTTINNGNNFGSSTSSPFYTDAAIRAVTFTASGTTATITLNITGGNSTSIINAIEIGQ
jgi:hypothetical protein